MTNNEGGTNDEEFRNVAVVDRVNTTMAVWMGTTMACAQCHDHKYDPITQEEYFRLFAFFNNTEDADRGDESPILSLFTDDQKRLREVWEREVHELETTLRTPTPERLAGQGRWEEKFATEPSWRPLRPGESSSNSGARMKRLEDHSILVEPSGKTDVYTVEFPEVGPRLAALRLETLPHDSLPAKGPGLAAGNFVVSRVRATIMPPGGRRLAGRFVRLELPGKDRILSLAEVQVFDGTDNLARRGTARQSSTASDGPAKLAIDGNTDGRYQEARSTTHTETSADPWWEVDLRSEQPIDRIVLWNRTDNGLHTRLGGVRIVVLDEKRQPVWTQTVAEPPNPSTALALTGAREVTFVGAYADYSQPNFEAANVLENKDLANRGWAVGGQAGRPHELTLVPASPLAIEPGSRLTVTIRQTSRFDEHLIGRFRIAVTGDDRAGESARMPESIRSILKTAATRRTEAQRSELTRYYLSAAAPELKGERERLARLRDQIAAMKPGATVPILRENAAGSRRTTQIQRRGNFLDLGAEVTAGIPAAFASAVSRGASRPAGAGALAGRGGQPADGPGDRQSPLGADLRHRHRRHERGVRHPGRAADAPRAARLAGHRAGATALGQLKPFLKLLVTSATYRQSLAGHARSPRARPGEPAARPRPAVPARRPRRSATRRCSSAACSARKMYGPPVRPPQPTLGPDRRLRQRHRLADRARATTATAAPSTPAWRRSNPYPSMATFDAPNREVCTVRRTRTNTPLQALVTLNDPVYVEAAQALARRMARGGKTDAEKADLGFRALPLPAARQTRSSTGWSGSTRPPASEFARDPAKARRLATDPLGPAPAGTDRRRPGRLDGRRQRAAEPGRDVDETVIRARAFADPESKRCIPDMNGCGI